MSPKQNEYSSSTRVWGTGQTIFFNGRGKSFVRKCADLDEIQYQCFNLKRNKLPVYYQISKRFTYIFMRYNIFYRKASGIIKVSTMEKGRCEFSRVTYVLYIEALINETEVKLINRNQTLLMFRIILLNIIIINVKTHSFKGIVMRLWFNFTTCNKFTYGLQISIWIRTALLIILTVLLVILPNIINRHVRNAELWLLKIT
jgi:hypothetical protein